MTQDYRVTGVSMDGAPMAGLTGQLRVWRDEAGRIDWEMRLTSQGISKPPPGDGGTIEAELGDGRTFAGGFVAPNTTISNGGTSMRLKGNGKFTGLDEWEPRP